MEIRFGVYCKEYPNKNYLYEEDLNSFSNLEGIIKEYGFDNVYFTEAGTEYIKNNFSVDELKEFGELFNYDNVEEFLNFLYANSVIDSDDVFVWNEEDMIKNITGIADKNMSIHSKVIYKGNKLEFTTGFFKELLEMSIENCEAGFFNEEIFNYLWDEQIQHFLTINKQAIPFDYGLTDIYHLLFIYSMDIEDRLQETYESLLKFMAEESKPVYQRDVPIYAMEYIVKKLDEYPQVHDYYPQVYINYLDRLCAVHNPIGLRIKAYAYYGGNDYVRCDYKISEECLLELLEQEYNDDYANTLGYIYYYGRVNNGVPQYDKAVQYFIMSSIAGNVEATYKLGDMYKNGYFFPKNEAAAKACYENLYPKVLYEFNKNPEFSNLADIAFRIGSFYENEQDAYYATRMYLEALMAVKIRNNRFDAGVKKKITNNLVELYKKYSKVINEKNTIYNSMIHWGNDCIYVEHKEDYLEISAEDKHILLDTEQLNCVYTDKFKLRFTGEIIKDFEGKMKCDEIETNEDGNYQFIYDDEIIGVIGKGELQIVFDGPLIENIYCQEEYNVAICTYSKNSGKKYTFIVEGNGSLDDSWMIIEDGKDIFPVEFKTLKSYELPLSINAMKHIKKKSNK